MTLNLRLIAQLTSAGESTTVFHVIQFQNLNRSLYPSRERDNNTVRERLHAVANAWALVKLKSKQVLRSLAPSKTIECTHFSILSLAKSRGANQHIE